MKESAADTLGDFEAGTLTKYESFDGVDEMDWFANNKHWLLILLLAYFGSIRALRQWMSDREAFAMKVPLILWNASLAVFSLTGAYRLLPELIQVKRIKSFVLLSVALLCALTVSISS